MQSIVVERFGGPEALTVRTGSTPVAAGRDVLVKVELAGVAASDLLMREGAYPGGPKPPFTPGWDVVGVVEKTGDAVDPSLLGAKVAGLSFTGGYVSHAVIDSRFVVRLPAGVEAASAACLTLNYVTAWQMIVRVARASPGQTILVQGAAGGIGTAALDIARAIGLRGYGVASQAKAAAVEAYGATWLGGGDEIAAAAAVGGFNIALDPFAGSATWRAMRLLARRGRIVTYGFTGIGRAAIMPRLAAHVVQMRLRSMVGGRTATFFRLSQSARGDPGAYRDDLAALLSLLETRQLSPLIAGILPLTQACDAHRRLASRSVEGKLLLDAQSPTPPQ